MTKEELKELEVRVKRRIGILVALIGVVGFISLIGLVIFFSRPPKVEEEPVGDYPAQEAHVQYDDVVPVQSMGTNHNFWEYEMPFTDDDYEERQDIIDSGKLLLWKEFTDDNVMWIVGHNPGTMSYVAQNTDVGSIIEVSSPYMYNGRYPHDKPDVATFKIVEVLETDIYAQDKFETIDTIAGDLYNYGADESLLVLQHSGEGDGIILYLGIPESYHISERISHEVAD